MMPEKHRYCLLLKESKNPEKTSSKEVLNDDYAIVQKVLSSLIKKLKRTHVIDLGNSLKEINIKNYATN